MALTCRMNKDISQLENTIEKEVKHIVSSQKITSSKRNGSVDRVLNYILKGCYSESHHRGVTVLCP